MSGATPSHGQLSAARPAPKWPNGKPGNRAGTRWRGKLQVPRCHPAVQRLIREANEQMTTLTEIAERAGIRRCSLNQWGKKTHPRVDDLEAALNVLGLETKVVRRRDAA